MPLTLLLTQLLPVLQLLSHNLATRQDATEQKLKLLQQWREEQQQQRQSSTSAKPPQDNPKHPNWLNKKNAATAACVIASAFLPGNVISKALQLGPMLFVLHGKSKL